MNELLSLIQSWILGILLGEIFYGGLWWTVKKTLSSKYVGAWFLVSWLTRMTIAMTGFYFISNHDWKKMLLCLVGFLMARFMVLWITRPENSSINHPKGIHENIS